MRRLPDWVPAVAWVFAGVVGGIAGVAACGPMDTADAGGDAGCSTCSGTCTCSISDPVTIAEPVDVSVLGPVDVDVTSPVTVASPVDVNVLSPVTVASPLDVTVTNALPMDVTVTNATPINVAVTTPLTVGPPAALTFKGVTSATFDGAAGWGTMNTACNTDYPGSRLCTDVQLMNVFPAATPPANAWVLMLPYTISGYGVHPSWGGYPYGSNGSSTNCSNTAMTTAFSSATAGYNGYVATPAGDFDTISCATLNPAACCGF